MSREPRAASREPRASVKLEVHCATRGLRQGTASLAAEKVGYRRPRVRARPRVVPISPFYFCHHEEAFRPTRDLLFDFFGGLLSRADQCARENMAFRPEAKIAAASNRQTPPDRGARRASFVLAVGVSPRSHPQTKIRAPSGAARRLGARSSLLETLSLTP